MKVNGLIIFLFLLPFSGLGQIRLNGRVLDSLTREPIPFSKVRMKVQNSATVSSAEGEYEIHSSYPIDTVLVDFIGYKQAVISVSENTVSPLNILLRENVASLDEVVITAGENPVFEILRKIKEKKPQNNPEKLEAYECKVYNKMQFSVNNMGDKFEERRAYRKFDFIMDYVDNLNGEKYLPVL